MPRVTFIDPTGQETTLDIPSGNSVMEGAVKNGVSGIEAECGGSLACATCHVFVADDWFSKVGGPEDVEQDMLECAETPAGPTSRLSCQIVLTDELDGLVVRLPDAQS